MLWSKQAQKHWDCTPCLLGYSSPSPISRVTYYPHDEPGILVSTIQTLEISYHSKQTMSVVRGLQNQHVKSGFYQVKLLGESSAVGRSTPCCHVMFTCATLRAEEHAFCQSDFLVTASHLHLHLHLTNHCWANRRLDGILFRSCVFEMAQLCLQRRFRPRDFESES